MNKFTLIIARHGKASLMMGSDTDFKRVLKDRGVEESKHVGTSLKKMIGNVDLVISSSAVRAKHTAEIISKELDYSIEKIQLEPSLYESGIEDALLILKQIKSSKRKVLLVGHNPTWSNLVNLFQPNFVAGLRTADVAVITFELPDWESIHPLSGELLYNGRFESNIK